jgi:hypothetical protein
MVIILEIQAHNKSHRLSVQWSTLHWKVDSEVLGLPNHIENDSRAS